MNKNYPFNNTTRLNHLINSYKTFKISNPGLRSATSFGEYIKSIEFNKFGSEFYHINSICSCSLYRPLNKACVPDKSLFREGMTVWNYITTYVDSNHSSAGLDSNSNRTKDYRTVSESKRFVELEKLPHIRDIKNNKLVAQDIINKLRSQVTKYKSYLDDASKMLNETEEYVQLLAKQDDNRPELWSKLRSCSKCGDLSYSEFQTLCDEFEIDDEMIDYYVSNSRIKYAFKPYIVCKYA